VQCKLNSFRFSRCSARYKFRHKHVYLNDSSYTYFIIHMIYCIDSCAYVFQHSTESYLWVDY